MVLWSQRASATIVASEPWENQTWTSTLREIDIHDRNMDIWAASLSKGMLSFKRKIGNVDISKENDDANPLVCVHHVQLLRDVKGLVDQWGKVYLCNFKFCHN